MAREQGGSCPITSSRLGWHGCRKRAHASCLQQCLTLNTICSHHLGSHGGAECIAEKTLEGLANFCTPNFGKPTVGTSATVTTPPRIYEA
eukprot:10767260-Alexandrium_andersonii.AAC.1